MVPLGSLLDVRRTEGAELITRYNHYPAAAIFGSAAPDSAPARPSPRWSGWPRRVLPQGFGYEWTATSYQEKQVGYQAYFIYALSITLVFMVLAALYESWTSPAAVILAVPMALVGVLVALMLRGYDNNLYTQIGLVLMIALASKNAILIVEFARDLQAGGHVHHGGRDRGDEPAVPPHRHDLVCLYPGRGASAPGHRRGCGGPEGDRHGGLRGHAGLDAARDPLRPRVLRDHADVGRAAAGVAKKNQGRRRRGDEPMMKRLVGIYETR